MGAECWNLDLLASLTLKLKINTTNRLNVVDYPGSDPLLRAAMGHLTNFRTLRQFRTATRQNNSASAALYRSKEDNCLDE